MAEKDLQLNSTPRWSRAQCFVAPEQPRISGLGEAPRNCAVTKPWCPGAAARLCIGRRGEGPGAPEPEANHNPPTCWLASAPSIRPGIQQRLVEDSGGVAGAHPLLQLQRPVAGPGRSARADAVRAKRELAFSGPDERVLLSKGDQLLIETHRRHRWCDFRYSTPRNPHGCSVSGGSDP